MYLKISHPKESKHYLFQSCFASKLFSLVCYRILNVKIGKGKYQLHDLILLKC
jgi:hypothetical protein